MEAIINVTGRPVEAAPVPPRPRLTDKSVVDAAARKLFPEVKEWMGDMFKTCRETEETVLTDLRDAIKREWIDGYRMARFLEKECTWTPDCRLVEILEGVDLHGCLRDAERLWVIKNQIRPALAVGDPCRFTQSNSGRIGTITAIHPEGKYSIYCPALGHVPAGHLGTQATIVAWETVCPVLAPASEAA